MGRPTPYIGAPSEVNYFFTGAVTGLAALQTADSLRNRKVYTLVVAIIDYIII